MVIQWVQIRWIWCHWSLSLKSGQLTLSQSCARSVCAVNQYAPSCWKMNPAGSRRLYVINSESRRPMLYAASTSAFSPTKCSWSFLPKRRKENWSSHMHGTIYPRNPSTTTSKTLQRDSEYCVVTGGGHIEHMLWYTIKFVLQQLLEMWLNKIVFVTFSCVTCFWTVKKQWVDSSKLT